jgi:hypothetical protein
LTIPTGQFCSRLSAGAPRADDLDGPDRADDAELLTEAPPGATFEVGEPRLTVSGTVQALIAELVDGSPNLEARIRARMAAKR